MYEASTTLATCCDLWRLGVFGGGLCFELVQLFPDKRQVLHVEERDVEHVTDDHYGAAGLNNFQHTHVHRFAPHRFDERQYDMPAIEHGNRQHVQNRQVHIEDHAEPERQLPTSFSFKKPYINIPNPDRAAQMLQL